MKDKVQQQVAGRGNNSEVVALSGLLEALCKLWMGISALMGCCHGGMAEVLFAPKMNGFKDADLRLAGSGGAILVGRCGYGMTCSDAALE